MTVIRPNSVSGINSITAQADEIKVFKSDGTQGGLIIGGANLNATSGISTLLALNVTGNVSIAGTLTYQDVTNVDSVGIITARSTIDAQGNVSIADKIIHTGDTNTAIRFPAADTITAETGGSERFRITSDGKIGINCTPLSQFQVKTGTNLNIAFNSSGSNSRISAYNDAANASVPLIINGSDLRFTISDTERLRITSDGNISINNSAGLSSTYSSFKHFSINNNLILNAPDSAGGFAGMHNNAYLNSSGNWVRVNNDHATSIGTDDGNFYFRNAGAGTGNITWNHPFRITSSGDIGFNDTAPTAHASGNNTVLSIKGKGSSYSGKIDFKDSDGNLDSYITSDNSILQFYADPNSQNGNTLMRFYVHGAERFRFGAAGQFGIGTNYGTAGQVLKSGGASAAPTWGSASSGGVETYALAVFGSVYDTNSGYILHNITTGYSNNITVDTSNERLTPTVSGTYLIIYNAHWLGLHSSGTTYYNRITKNGSEIMSSNFSAYNAGSHMHTVLTTTSMNGSSDYIQFEFYENKAGAAAYVSHKSRAIMILLDT